MLKREVREAIITLDAAIFNGDAFQNDKERIELKKMLRRWKSELHRIAAEKAKLAVEGRK